MLVEYAFIAESADVVAGLFYVVRGGTDIWSAPAGSTFPVALGPMSFVVRLVGDPVEVGSDFPVEFTIVDADGHTVGVNGTGTIAVAPHVVDRTRSGAALLHFRLGFSVPAAGAYFFELHSAGERLCQVPFWVLPPGETVKPPGQP